MGDDLFSLELTSLLESDRRFNCPGAPLTEGFFGV